MGLSQAYVIVNPASGAGETGHRWPSIAELLCKIIGKFDVAFTRERGHAIVLARQGLFDGHSLILAVGGDGTINEVANGFFDGKRLINPESILAIVPAGTGSDFDRSLNAAEPAAGAYERLAAGRFRTIDIGRASYVNCSGVPASRVFLNVGSLGCSANAVHMMGRRWKKVGGKYTYLAGAAVALLGNRDKVVGIEVDGLEREEITATNVAICNGTYFGAGIRVAPLAAFDDGLFDVTVWAGIGIADLIRKRRSLFDGSHLREPGTRAFRAKHLRITCGQDLPIELDGEPVGRLPASFEILPQALRVSG